MPSMQVENSPKFANRMHDTSSWQEGDITSLTSRAKKSYQKRKSALIEYFTTEASIDEIAQRYHLSARNLSRLAKKCLMPHEDGAPWGFRALLPRITVTDHTTQPHSPTSATEDNQEAAEAPQEAISAPLIEAEKACSDSRTSTETEQSAILIEEAVDDDEDTAKRQAVKLPVLPPLFDLDVPETPAHTSTLNAEVEEKQPGAKITTPLEVVTAGVTRVITTAPQVHPAQAGKSSYTANKRVIQRRQLRKRWQREVQGQYKQKRSLQIASFAILAAVILFVLIPAGAGLAAYGAYNNISVLAHDGVNHLLKVKSIFNVSKSDPSALLGALNATKLTQAQAEFKASENDFVQLQQLVNRSDVQTAITQFAPQYDGKLGMAESLVQVALDVSHMGNELTGVALIGANVIHGSPLAAGSKKPVISVADITAIDAAMVHALYYIGDIRTQMSHISVKDLPISAAQKTQLTALLPLLPKAENMIIQGQSLVDLVAWLLGVGHPRRFLVQTMDRGELRPGGGFTGQYGILQIQDGRMAPLTLSDVAVLDYAENGTAIGRKAPPNYSWMNFGNWGVRDSNLSADFPTTARMTMQLFQDEGGGPVDGDIAFTPVLIGHVLDVTGPIKVPGYQETITSKNLEERLHYYQQDFSAIAREQKISGNYSHTGRKAFTSTLGKMLLDRLRHLPANKLVDVVKTAIKDIQSRDLELYFTNPAVEGWLMQHSYSGSMNTFSKQDGFMVVQANISISKASQYVHTTEQDNVTLDAQGGATHNLTITLDYRQTGPVYGFDTYADYIRVYAPQSATLISGDGFDTGQLLCKPTAISTGKVTPTGTPRPPTTGCAQYNGYFPSNARYCPNGNYSLGLRGGGINTSWPIDSLGPPTAQASDLPGFAMWGGLTETPKNCTSYITLSWYVPHAVKKVNGQPSYSILIQKQSGYIPTIELAIDATAIKGLKSFSFNGAINTDRLFTLTPPQKR